MSRRDWLFVIACGLAGAGGALYVFHLLIKGGLIRVSP